MPKYVPPFDSVYNGIYPMTRARIGPNQRKLYKISIIDPSPLCHIKNDFLYTQNG